MGREAFFYLGRILRTHGHQGEVLVHLDVDDPERYRKLESVFLDPGGERIPFFIESVSLRPNKRGVIRFQDYDDPDDAAALVGLRMYLPADRLPQLRGNKFYFHEVTGFTVEDKTHGPIGTVAEVLDLPGQPLLRVQHGEREILIPVVDEIVRKIDRKNRVIRVETPPGLIGIYL